LLPVTTKGSTWFTRWLGYTKQIARRARHRPMGRKDWRDLVRVKKSVKDFKGERYRPPTKTITQELLIAGASGFGKLIRSKKLEKSLKSV